jgi:hypothetical protein
LEKGNWNTEEYIILLIMPLAIMQILSFFEEQNSIMHNQKKPIMQILLMGQG